MPKLTIMISKDAMNDVPTKNGEESLIKEYAMFISQRWAESVTIVPQDEAVMKQLFFSPSAFTIVKNNSSPVKEAGMKQKILDPNLPINKYATPSPRAEAR